MNTIWLVVAIAFGLVEILTPNLTLIWFSIGALVTMLLSLFIKNIIVQICIFAVVSIALLVIFTKYFVDKDKGYKYNTNLQGIEQKKGVVKTEIIPFKTGLVTLGGEDWTAISEGNIKIEEGTVVEVVKIEGVKLIVRPVNINSEEKSKI